MISNKIWSKQPMESHSRANCFYETGKTILSSIFNLITRINTHCETLASEIKVEKSYILISILSITLLIVWLGTSSILLLFFEPITSGQIGDTFGTVNSLFSGLALGGVILSIYIQRLELSEQRKELELTRNEMSDQRIVWETQRFENLFFNLLELHKSNVESIVISYHDHSEGTYKKKEKHGRDAIHYIVDNVLYTIKKNKIKDIENFENSFNQEMDQHTHLFGHYFRQLFRIAYIVDTRNIDNEQKQEYFKILSSQLTVDELGLLLCNCLTTNGSKFKLIVENTAYLSTQSIYWTTTTYSI